MLTSWVNMREMKFSVMDDVLRDWVARTRELTWWRREPNIFAFRDLAKDVMVPVHVLFLGDNTKLQGRVFISL